MARKQRITNAQEIYKSSISTRKLIKELESSFKMAQRRMQRLKKAGLSKSEFYREHRKDFIELDVGRRRLEVSKELAMVNRFLSSKSSTVKGLKEAERQYIQTINEKVMFDNVLNEKNVRSFQAFMKEYYDKYVEQSELQSDIVIEAFVEAERLQLSKKDLLANLDMFNKYKEKIKNLKVEDFLQEGEKLDKRRRFKLSEYEIL